MMTDLEELGDVGTQEGLNVVALVDRSAEYSDEPVLGLDPWSGAKYLEIDQNEATVLEDMGDVNTGDPNVLADFIARAIYDYPADHYALIISDHADWTELTSTLEDMSPQDLWITHGEEAALMSWARQKGIPAQPLSIAGYGSDDDGEDA